MAKQTCTACGVRLTLPSPVDAETRRHVATLWRGGHTGEALAALGEVLGVDQAPFYLLHLPRWRGWCHRCRASKPATGEDACPACGALNLAWEGSADPAGPPLEGPEPVTDHRVALSVCPACGSEISHGTTRCWQPGCGFTLPEGYVAVAGE